MAFLPSSSPTASCASSSSFDPDATLIFVDPDDTSLSDSGLMRNSQPGSADALFTFTMPTFPDHDDDADDRDGVDDGSVFAFPMTGTLSIVGDGTDDDDDDDESKKNVASRSPSDEEEEDDDAPSITVMHFRDESDEDIDDNDGHGYRDSASFCRYCFLADPACLAQCGVCKAWFCNGKGSTSGAHIVGHLVRAKHKEVALHKDGPLGDERLECYSCGSRNVFNLGFIPAKAESVIVLLCRHPCAALRDLKDMDWKAELWKPLVCAAERALVPWLARVPSPAAQARGRPITAAQIRKLEDLWKTDPAATLNDVDRPGGGEESDLPAAVAERYVDGFHYQNVFGPLVKLEEEHQRAAKAAVSVDDVEIAWEVGGGEGGSKAVARMMLPRRDSGSAFKVFAQLSFVPSQCSYPKVMTGDELRLRYLSTFGDSGKTWAGSGHVTFIDNMTDEVINY